MSEMEPQQAYQGFTPASYGAVQVQAAVPLPAPVLRPLSTGEILDRTLALYRRHFWLFVGIGAVPGVMLTLSSGLRFLFLNSFMTRLGGPVGAHPPAMTPHELSSMLLMQVLFLPAILLFLLAYGVSQAATVRAVEGTSRGMVMTAVEAYRAVKPHWLRWCGIVLRQLWSAVWPFTVGILFLGMGAAASALAGTKNPVLYGVLALLAFVLMLVGLVFGVLNYIRVALAQAAGVVEDLGVNAALRRSRMLVAGRKGRIFLALLLVYVLQMVAGGLQLPFVFLAQTMHGVQRVLLMATDLLIAFVATSLVTPVLSIAMSLFYTDERVRREGYDIELLLQRSITEQTEAGAR